MIRYLLIYAAAIVAFIVAGTIATGTPLEQVAWLVLLVEVVPLATVGAAMSIRRMTRPKRRDDWQHLGCDPVVPLATVGAAMSIRRMARPKRRDDWQHLGCDPVAPPLLPPAPRVRIEAPQPLMLEAPRKELTP